MVPLSYLALRLIRRHLPGRAVRMLLHRGLIIRAGMETSAPDAAVRRFKDAIGASGETVAGRRVLIFGYGGRLDVAIEMLRAGARHVVLVDPYAEPFTTDVIPGWAHANSQYLKISGSTATPDPAWLTLLHAPLGHFISGGGEPVDLVLSNSVLEHVEDVPRTVLELARTTAPNGQHFHFIDLRDHFFKYPFEMLAHSEAVWRRFLNPGSNLNRLRAWDYERLFTASFGHVSVEVRHSEVVAFRAARSRIRPEFLTGDEERDAVTQILLRASLPRHSQHSDRSLHSERAADPGRGSSPQ